MAGNKHVFISYSSHDYPAAQRILRAIEARGMACWISSRDVPPGGNFASAIVEAIENAYAMVLVFSANANQRAEEIKKEIVLAGQSNLVVVPARIENLLPSDRAFRYEMATRQWVDLFDNWDAGIDRMVSTLLQLKPAAAAVATGADAAANSGPDTPAAQGGGGGMSLHIRLPRFSLPRLNLARRGLVLGLAALIGVPALAAGGWYAWQANEARESERARELTASGLRNLQTAQYQKAVEELDEAIRLDDRIAEAWKWRGSSNAMLNKNQEAIRDYKMAVKLDPQDFETWRVMGTRIYPALGDRYAARSALDQAVKLRPTSPTVLYDRANARNNTGDTDGAIADLNEAIRLDPRYAEAYRARGWIYANSSYDRAWPEFDQAIRLEPRNPRNYQMRGELRQRAGDFAGAQADRAQAQALGGAPTATPPAQPTPPTTKQ